MNAFRSSYSAAAPQSYVLPFETASPGSVGRGVDFTRTKRRSILSLTRAACCRRMAFYLSLASHQVLDNLVSLPRIRIFLWAFTISQYNLHTMLFTPHSRHIYRDRRSCSRSQGGRRNANFDAHTISYLISSHRIWKHCNAACEEGAKAYEPCSMGWVSWVGACCFHATYSEMIGNGLGRWDSHGSIDSSTLLICTCTRLQGKFRYRTVPRVYRS